VPLKDLMMAVMMGARDEDVFTSLAGRLARLEKEMTAEEKGQLTEYTGGHAIKDMCKALLHAFDPDKIVEAAAAENKLSAGQSPTDKQIEAAREKLSDAAAMLLTGQVVDYLDNVRKVHEQIIDVVNLDTVQFAGWDAQAKDRAESLVKEFKDFIEANKNEITALKVFYGIPYQQRNITYQMIKELAQALKMKKPNLAPLPVWQAYQQLEAAKGSSPINQLTALVSLVRRVVGRDSTLTSYESTVNKNFQDWVFKKQAGPVKFTEEQMEWLRMLKEHILSSFHVDREDLNYAPFDARGGIGKMYKLFGDRTDEIITELNKHLVA
jgi:type I restriction enzyme R subunit